VKRPRPITFLSDYGTDDEFAGVCRAVIAAIAPGALVIDLTHGIARHDVRRGAEALASALPFAPPGVHLAVVDPGVGGERRAVALALAEEERFLVGPDNGLLWSAAERLGGVGRAVEVSRSPARLEPVSATFHGRDVFAPVAARLSMGDPLEALGERIDPDVLVRCERRLPEIEPGVRVRAAVAYADGFGNAALDLSPDEAAQAGLGIGERLHVRSDVASAEAVYARTFADLEPGALLLYRSSRGAMGLAVNLGSAAEGLGVTGGDYVVLERA